MCRQSVIDIFKNEADFEHFEVINIDEGMFNLKKRIENIKKIMSGSGTEVEKEDVDDLLEQATAANKGERVETQEPPKGLSAVELAKAAQKAAKPDPKEVKETKSAVEMAKEAQLKEQAKKTPEEEKDSEESIEDLLNDDFDDLEIEENQNEEQTSAVPEKMDAEESESSSEEVQSEEVSEETSDELKESDTEESQQDISEESKLSENQKDSQEDEEEYEYVDPGELVLGNHTQAEIDEAMENLASLGLEGDVYERAKRMLLLELAGSEAVLDAWLKEQEGNKKKKAAVSALDGEDNLGDLSDFDEEALEKELELAMDEDFLMEDEAYAFHFHPQLAQHHIATAQRRLVIHLYAVEHGVNSILLHLAERKACHIAKFVTCMFQIVQVVGIIHDAFTVDFVVTHLHLEHEYIFFLCHILFLCLLHSQSYKKLE